MTETKTKLTVRKDGDKLVDILRDALPHGSGIDADWYIRRLPGHGFQCNNSYHAMDCMGGYVGWLDFTVYYKWNEEGQQFEFKRLTTDPLTTEFIQYDEEGDEYDDLDSLQEYLDSCFDNEIKLDYPTLDKVVSRLTNQWRNTRAVLQDGYIVVSAWNRDIELGVFINDVLHSFDFPVKWVNVLSPKWDEARHTLEMWIKVEIE